MTENKRDRKCFVLYPAGNDPRWIILLFLGSYVIYAMSSPGFNRNPWQFVAALSTCLIVDFILLRFFKGTPIVPLSGLITSLGTFLLTDSRFVWPYAAVACLSILSKHFIRFEGRHIFNPNNFGLVFAVALFGDRITVIAGRWGGSLSGMLLIAVLGFYLVHRAKRLDLVLSYLFIFALGVVCRAWIGGKDVMMVAAPLTGAAFQLFLFYMISDPATTPRTRRQRIAFGAVLAVIDSVLRYEQNKFAPFQALFILLGVWPIVAHLFPTEKEDAPVWQLRGITLSPNSLAGRLFRWKSLHPPY